MASPGIGTALLEFALEELSRPAEAMDATYLDYAHTALSVLSEDRRGIQAPLGTGRVEATELLELLGPHMEARTISLERRTLACIWYVSNTETFRSVVDRFNMSKGSLHYYLHNFCRTLTARQYCQTLYPGQKFVIMPVLQTNVQIELAFQVVFKNSPLAQKLADDPLPKEYHLLGDSAYGLSSSLLVPFRDNGHLTNVEKRYNSAHSSTRVDIERCFGLLKGKFRKLKFLDMRNVRDIPLVIVACCALHNFILARESFSEIELDIEEAASADDSNTGLNCKSGIAKREEIAQLLA
ncbi:uncharacterized protein [Haliotis cracherodii]|uniref:uncharacterized protein n=1 Tax=Haliotis cracherodii TaxID=6455 RepID=UPI0039E8FF22